MWLKKPIKRFFSTFSPLTHPVTLCLNLINKIDFTHVIRIDNLWHKNGSIAIVCKILLKTCFYYHEGHEDNEVKRIEQFVE